MKSQPLKRHKALQNLSREHHDALVFALRLQKGVAKHATIEDMQAYIDWFWASHLSEHFLLEEEHLFPMVKESNELIVKAKAQHRQIKALVDTQLKTYESLKRLYTLIQTHIRFEERQLFMQIQNELSEKDLSQFQNLHQKQIECAFWPKQFWQ